MLHSEDKLPDNICDDVNRHLTRFNHVKIDKGWNKEKLTRFKELEESIKRNAYELFVIDLRFIHLQRSGESCVYDVPENQRGKLKKFCNKRIRIICLYRLDSHTGRVYAIKEIKKTNARLMLIHGGKP